MSPLDGVVALPRMQEKSHAADACEPGDVSATTEPATTVPPPRMASEGGVWEAVVISLPPPASLERHGPTSPARETWQTSTTRAFALDCEPCVKLNEDSTSLLETESKTPLAACEDNPGTTNTGPVSSTLP